MKTKLFNALKQAHSKLGLADEVLQAYAESLAATGLVTDENLATVVQGQEGALRQVQSSLDKERTERTRLAKEIEDLKKPPITTQPTNDSSLEKMKAIEAKFLEYEKELTELKNRAKVGERQAFINKKAEELGIPEWRVKEGFAISDDMDEAAIATRLGEVRKNIVAAGLTTEGRSFATDVESSKTEALEWAKKLPDNI